MTRLMTTAVLLLTFLLAGCDQTPTSSDTPAHKATAGAYKATDKQLKQAELLTLSSKVGALQGCRALDIYTSPIVDDTFYRLATIMRAFMQSNDEAIKDFVQRAFGIYWISGQTHHYAEFTPKPEDANGVDMEIAENSAMDEATCKKIETDLETARKKNGTLDVVPAKPIQQTPPPGPSDL